MENREPFTFEEKRETAETREAVRYVGIVMVVAAAVLVVGNSAGLQTWTRNLPGNTMTDRWVTEADNWHAIMARLGFASPKVAIQTVVGNVRTLAWSGGSGADATLASADTDGGESVEPVSWDDLEDEEQNAQEGS